MFTVVEIVPFSILVNESLIFDINRLFYYYIRYNSGDFGYIFVRESCEHVRSAIDFTL